ncbi:MAG: 2-C-methyl-D-erythritol 2,4-cyclodiphosphate synthase [Clostridiales bacterium]|jgi:2-C-methyl-D-erythritol 2,4-cyclodiphosphate synthase|nr:2-C-methyl-D-erythritol 2,4-cyclodiphosphate synthase [Clostridiales bacterium]
MRIGHGYDVHKIDPEKEILILGGVEIACGFGMVAHSDGDVLLHAVIDALLGAAGMGDIGSLFPDTDMTYRDISSMLLLTDVMRRIRGSGLEIEYVDATLIAQKPKLYPYIQKIRASLAAGMGIETRQCNVKATTEEGLGFTGRGEGIAAHAVCLLNGKI